jgi:hypothetical protein
MSIFINLVIMSIAALKLTFATHFQNAHLSEVAAKSAYRAVASKGTSSPRIEHRSPRRFKQQFEHLAKKAPTLNRNVLKLALQAYQRAKLQGAVKKPVLTVIDYSLPSNKQRMWIFDLKKQRLLFNTHVAHGQNSGSVVPRHFSNRPSSRATSLGTFVTKNTYFGSKGLSLNLQGLEKGFNDNAYRRRVVIHGAWYMEPRFIKNSGRAGRSWGCPSVAHTIAKPLINTIKGGTVLFAYYPDKYYLSHSGYVSA